MFFNFIHVQQYEQSDWTFALLATSKECRGATMHHAKSMWLCKHLLPEMPDLQCKFLPIERNALLFVSFKKALESSVTSMRIIRFGRKATAITMLVRRVKVLNGDWPGSGFIVRLALSDSWVTLPTHLLNAQLMASVFLSKNYHFTPQSLTKDWVMHYVPETYPAVGFRICIFQDPN